MGHRFCNHGYFDTLVSTCTEQCRSIRFATQPKSLLSTGFTDFTKGTAGKIRTIRGIGGCNHKFYEARISVAEVRKAIGGSDYYGEAFGRETICGFFRRERMGARVHSDNAWFGIRTMAAFLSFELKANSEENLL